MKRHFFFFIIVLCTVPNAVAQNKGQSVATIATYEGVDRMARLIEGAKKEGMLNEAIYQHQGRRNCRPGFTKRAYLKRDPIPVGGSQSIPARQGLWRCSPGG